MNARRRSDIRAIQNLVHRFSNSRMATYCRGLNFDAETDSGDHEQVFGQEMSIILISGYSGSITLKVHFDLETARKLASHTYQRSQEQVNDEIAREFMKEYSNLFAGSFRGVLEKKSMLLGMSLPFLADGTDELFYRKLMQTSVERSLWRLKSELGCIVCTSEIVFTDENEIAQLCKVSENIINDDRVAQQNPANLQPVTDESFEFL